MKTIAEITLGLVLLFGIVAMTMWGQTEELCKIENPAHEVCKDHRSFK
jgi:hypothetical protein